MVVVGVGAIALAAPPVAFVPYQFNVPPEPAVAAKAVAVAFLQYVTGVVDGAAGVAFIFTTIAALGLSQLLIVWDT